MAAFRPVHGGFQDVQFITITYSLESGTALAKADLDLTIDDVETTYRTCP